MDLIKMLNMVLPPELLVNILSFIPPHEIDYLFDIPNLLQHSYDEPFTKFQKMAFYSKFLNRSVSVDQNFANHTLITLEELKYLIENSIYIKPKEITMTISTRLQSDGDFILFSQNSIPSNFNRYLQSLITSFNLKIRILDVETIEMDLLHSCTCFFQSLINVKKLTIEYTKLIQPELPNNNSNVLLVPRNDTNKPLDVENLKLNFYSGFLIQHLLNCQHCFLCQNLKYLDLSYNNIDNSVFQNIKYSKNVQYLNISNNGITKLKINPTDFPNLKYLDACNNKIKQICETNEQLPNLEIVNLSCNFINNLNDLKVFNNLKELNISRNLISQLGNSALPFQKIIKLNLQSNYLPNLLDELANKPRILPRSLQELDVSFCKVKITGKTNLLSLIKNLQDVPSMNKIHT